MRTGAGALQSQSEYDGYGIYSSLVSGLRTDFGYVGSKSYVTDPESGLLQLGHRYYLPILGRFLNQDPSGQADDLNLYAYCKDNPVTGVDPSGLDIEYIGSDNQKANYNKAMNWLETNPQMKKVITRLKNSLTTYFIDAEKSYSIYDTEFDPNSNTISWNPLLGLITTRNDGKVTLQDQTVQRYAWRTNYTTHMMLTLTRRR